MITIPVNVALLCLMKCAWIIKKSSILSEEGDLIDAMDAMDVQPVERREAPLKKRKCSVCNETAEEGLIVKRVEKDKFPPQSYFMCDKCAYVLRMLIMSHRRPKL